MTFEIDFQDGGHGGHLRYAIGTTFSNFLSTNHPYFLQSFESIGLSSHEMSKIDFLNDRNDFSYC